MKDLVLYREQLIPADIETAWSFFSSPENLEKITPPDMGFDVLTDVKNIKMFEGQIIDYVVRPMLGIPMKWRTEIRQVNEPFSFTDVQLKGPYSKWEHTHHFEQTENGTLMKDVIRYRVPFGPIGQLFNTLAIRRRLVHIFDFRQKIIYSVFDRI